jgi:AcrR family transcriptional regulator
VNNEDPRVTRTRKDVVDAALDLLFTQGWSAVTHAEVAKKSGYSRATIYGHWPTQMDLVRDAFKQYEQMPHFSETGDLATDLHGEIESFSDAMIHLHLDRALAMLSEKAQTSDEVAQIRDSFVAAGEKPIREALDGVNDIDTREAIALMLCGMVTHSVLMHGEPPSTELIHRGVELVLSSGSSNGR